MRALLINKTGTMEFPSFFKRLPAKVLQSFRKSLRCQFSKKKIRLIIGVVLQPYITEDFNGNRKKVAPSVQHVAARLYAYIWSLLNRRGRILFLCQPLVHTNTQLESWNLKASFICVISYGFRFAFSTLFNSALRLVEDNWDIMRWKR